MFSDSMYAACVVHWNVHMDLYIQFRLRRLTSAKHHMPMNKQGLSAERGETDVI